MERHSFSEALGSLQELVRDMGTTVQDRVGIAVASVLERRTDLVHPVISGDADINRLEQELDDRCLRLLAQQQPVARDLRLIISVMKVASDLERVGDQAVNIAGTSVLLASQASLPSVPQLPRLAEGAQAMLHDAIAAYLNGSVEVARSVLRRDDEIDALRNETFRVVVRAMTSNPGDIEPGLGLILVSRNLERIADHATNIAEDVVFLVEARDVRHQQESP